MLEIFLFGTVALSAKLVLAAMGGYVSERAGIMNIALEGNMLFAACLTALGAVTFGNPLAGLACGIGASVVASMVHWVLTQKFRIDQIISGMAINLLAIGGTNFIDKRFTDLSGAGTIVGFPNAIYYLCALVIPLALWQMSSRSRWGLHLRAVGSDPDKARQVGIKPERVRLIALIWTGVFCGLAGALIVTNSGRFVDNMTSGSGYIALAALIISGWRPLPAMAACIAFGALDQLQIQMQGVNLGFPLASEVWSSVPYLVTVIALAGLLGKNRAPQGMGKH